MGIEKVACVQIAVADKLERRSMECVSARLAHRAHHRARAAILRAVSRRESLEFRDGIDTERSPQRGRTRSMTPEVLHVLVVEQEGLTFRPGTGE